MPNEEHPTQFLSGGNQQKVCWPSGSTRGADVFIFDEPTHGIDVEGKEEIYDLMTELARRGKGVIFISSEFTELVGACNRVLVMREGRLVGEFEGDADHGRGARRVLLQPTEDRRRTGEKHGGRSEVAGVSSQSELVRPVGRVGREENRRKGMRR